MLKLAMSPAASALLRSLIARACVPRNRILLSNVRSVDWQSLTFIGERHEFDLRIIPPESQAISDRICRGLLCAEFDLPGQILADIAVRGHPRCTKDGAILLSIEALTIEE